MITRKKVVLLGATGSIGESTLKVIRTHSDKLELVGIAANKNLKKLSEIASEFDVANIALFDNDAFVEAKTSGAFRPGTHLLQGMDGLEELASLPECDTVLVAVVGTLGLKPALACIEAGKTLAVASKEILVLAGKFVMAKAREKGVSVLPVDSEHNAIFQCVHGEQSRHIEKLILTASGGSFRDLPLNQFANVTLEEALKHPNWDMGPKVTLDSATMANKGLEMIEARWLFDMDPSQIDVVIHPQSIAHSMAQFVDGSILAHLSPPDMTFAIQHCLLYPERDAGVVDALDFSQAMQLDFRPPEKERYPCLGLAKQAMQAGGIATGVFNAANEVAVDAFVNHQIGFIEIPQIIEKTLESIDNIEPNSIEEVLEYDRQARLRASQVLAK
ncbi:1-deoxy-D-xylulose-5-phosphate reductoisomerase [Puniceicoccaceae bacterium K14]|nr:1-deoxy-D-xylulose-5-phosphate reductoisomerase [Puniceicoccaceae bacterium K14]